MPHQKMHVIGHDCSGVDQPTLLRFQPIERAKDESGNGRRAQERWASFCRVQNGFDLVELETLQRRTILI